MGILRGMETSGFGEMFRQRNRLGDSAFEGWIFRPGMTFDSPDKWWGDFGKRQTRHEGVDFCLYRGPRGQVFNVPAGALVPVLYDGVVVAVIPDFLGHSVVVRHDVAGLFGQKLYTIYAHTVADPKIAEGARVQEGDVVAAVADTRTFGAPLLPHVHISAGFLKTGVSCDGLNWEDISRRKQIELIDPMLLLQPHRKGEVHGTRCI